MLIWNIYSLGLTVYTSYICIYALYHVQKMYMSAVYTYKNPNTKQSVVFLILSINSALNYFEHLSNINYDVIDIFLSTRRGLVALFDIQQCVMLNIPTPAQKYESDKVGFKS